MWDLRPTVVFHNTEHTRIKVNFLTVKVLTPYFVYLAGIHQNYTHGNKTVIVVFLAMTRHTPWLMTELPPRPTTHDTQTQRSTLSKTNEPCRYRHSTIISQVNA